MKERPHCQQPDACKAKTPGKHCQRCASGTPECRARKVAAAQRAIADPVILARKQAAARGCSANPEIVARRTATMLAKAATAEARAHHRAACAAATARRLADPVKREQLCELGRTIGLTNLRRAKSPEAIARRGATIRAKHLAWCPPEHWDLNRKLKGAGYPLSERKQMIADLVERSSPEAEGRRIVAQHAAEMRARHEREKASRY